MVDVAPSLYERVNAEFKNQIEKNKRLNILKKRIDEGKATYKELNEYAVKVGEALKGGFKTITADDLPDGMMYYNIADRVIRPNMVEEYEIVAEATIITQEALNKAANIGMKAVRPEINQNRIQGIIDRVTAEEFSLIAWILEEPIINYAQYVVDDSIKANADLQFKAGLQPKIIRKAEAPGVRSVKRGNKTYSYLVPCKWCARLEGEYDYYKVSNTGNDVFRRHENCRCEVTYYPGDGKRQNVWTKQFLDPGRDERIQLAKDLENGNVTAEERLALFADVLNLNN